MTGTILTLSLAYGLVAVLTGWLVAGSGLHWVLRGIAALSTAALIPLTYYGIGELRGMPSDAPPPPFFKLHWARVVEPNPLMKEAGSVFLWIEELDSDNFPSGLPRAHRLPYDPDLVRRVEAALAQIQQGQEVAGTISEMPVAEESTAEVLAAEVREDASREGPDAGSMGDRLWNFDPAMLTFGQAPAPVTPEKP